MAVIIDDAGSGDLLFGVVIGAYWSETQDFKYDVIDVSFFQRPRFGRKEYLNEASKIVFSLVGRLQVKTNETFKVCNSYLFDVAVQDLMQSYGIDGVCRVKVIGEPQRLTETAYLDEIRNLGYKPLMEREKKRAKSFYHMMRWLKGNQDMMKYAKTGWPRLSRYRLFREPKVK